MKPWAACSGTTMLPMQSKRCLSSSDCLVCNHLCNGSSAPAFHGPFTSTPQPCSSSSSCQDEQWQRNRLCKQHKLQLFTRSGNEKSDRIARRKIRLRKACSAIEEDMENKLRHDHNLRHRPGIQRRRASPRSTATGALADGPPGGATHVR